MSYIGNGSLEVSPEDELLNIWLVYIQDENEYIRPIYQLFLRGKSMSYFAAVDAIDDRYIQN